MSGELVRIQNFAAKQGTRDETKTKIKIKDYLWDGNTGLPESFGPEEIEEKADMIFMHVLMCAKRDNFSSQVRE